MVLPAALVSPPVTNPSASTAVPTEAAAAGSLTRVGHAVLPVFHADLHADAYG